MRGCPHRITDTHVGSQASTDRDASQWSDRGSASTRETHAHPAGGTQPGAPCQLANEDAAPPLSGRGHIPGHRRPPLVYCLTSYANFLDTVSQGNSQQLPRSIQWDAHLPFLPDPQTPSCCPQRQLAISLPPSPLSVSLSLSHTSHIHTPAPRGAAALLH